MYVYVSHDKLFSHQEHFGALEVHPSTHFLARWSQDGVIGLGEFYSGEEVRGDALKEREVVREELGQVDVSDGSQHEDIFILVWVLELRREVLVYSNVLGV